MRVVYTFLVGMVISGIAFGQNFEGRIIYQNTYHTKLNNVTDRQWDENMGTMEEYIIKDGNYKATTNGRLFEWQFYNNKDNKIYTKMSNSDYVYWNDGSVDEDSVISFEVRESDTVVMGYKCTELVLNCATGTQRYFFSKKLGINPRLFENHKFGNWYDYLKIANAVPLEIIIDTEDFTMTSVAVQIKSTKIDDTAFTLAPYMKTVKSPY